MAADAAPSHSQCRKTWRCFGKNPKATLSTLAAGARISKAWHHPFQHRLSQHIWLSSDAHFASSASRSYTANASLVQEITVGTSGQGICNPVPAYSCHCVVRLLGQFPSAATLSLCGAAWQVHPRCMHLSVTHQHITRLALVWVGFQSVMHFRLLLEAFPMLHGLECSHVQSADKTEGSPDLLPVMARCTNLRELMILDVDVHISAFLGNIQHGTDAPPVEILSVAPAVRVISRRRRGWKSYRAILDSYSASLRELKLMLHVKDEGFLPSMSHHSPYRSKVSPEKLITLLDISLVLRTIDKMLADEQFKSIHQKGVHIELVTPFSELSTIFDHALEPTGGWEESVRQWMPLANSAGLLHCVR